jgi:hypothetical protein
MKNEQMRVWVALLSGAGGLLGCSGGGNVNIGNTAVVGAQLSDYAASWDGYAEAYTFSPDGSDRVRLTIDATGQGTLQIGDAALLPTPTDPNVGFPQGISASVGSVVLVEGFLYPVYAAQVQSDRVQVGLNPGDLEATWCALQTPVASTSSSGSKLPDAGGTSTVYGCLPDWGFTLGTSNCSIADPDGQSDPVDCDKVYLCDSVHVCDCTASACTTRGQPAGTPVNQYPVELDAALDATGTTLTGTLNLAGTRVTVVLTKH